MEKLVLFKYNVMGYSVHMYIMGSERLFSCQNAKLCTVSKTTPKVN